MSFKKGDRVRCVDDSSLTGMKMAFLAKGDIYTIKNIKNTLNLEIVSLQEDNEENRWWGEFRFVLMRQAFCLSELD